MAFCRYVFPLLVLSVVSCYESKVPVYMWGDLSQSSLKANPLTTTSPGEFDGILNLELADNPLTVVFIEETLSVEDFSLKDADGETSFPYLHSKLRDAVYMPSVEDSVPVLRSIADGSKTIELVSNEELPEDAEPGSFIFVYLKDASEDESRLKLLRRHDDFMQETMSKLQSGDRKVVAIYTARYPSWIIPEPPVTHSRSRRAVSVENNVYVLDGLRLYAKSINLISKSVSNVLANPQSSKSNISESSQTNTINYENDTSITLNFYKKGGYWFFESVLLAIGSLSESLQAQDEVFAIEGFSYRCAQSVKFSSVNDTVDYTLQFEDLKIQPYFESTDNTTTVFGDSFNCVGFFTAPIWAGLFVVFILLAITFYGVMMMMDIRTMDRFDDPKGKTITINAGE